VRRYRYAGFAGRADFSLVVAVVGAEFLGWEVEGGGEAFGCPQGSPIPSHSSRLFLKLQSQRAEINREFGKREKRSDSRSMRMVHAGELVAKGLENGSADCFCGCNE